MSVKITKANKEHKYIHLMCTEDIEYDMIMFFLEKMENESCGR
jgi:hypothetical protein